MSGFFDMTSLAEGGVREDEVEKFKEFLDSVSPDDFKAT